MFIKFFRKVGLSTDIMYALAFASIGVSIATWAAAKSKGDADTGAHAERFGVFIGLWAPTFVGLGNAIADHKALDKL